jgi:hypothetical protein
MATTAVRMMHNAGVQRARATADSLRVDAHLSFDSPKRSHPQSLHAAAAQTKTGLSSGLPAALDRTRLRVKLRGKGNAWVAAAPHGSMARAIGAARAGVKLPSSEQTSIETARAAAMQFGSHPGSSARFVQLLAAPPATRVLEAKRALDAQGLSPRGKNGKLQLSAIAATAHRGVGACASARGAGAHQQPLTQAEYLSRWKKRWEKLGGGAGPSWYAAQCNRSAASAFPP